MLAFKVTKLIGLPISEDRGIIFGRNYIAHEKTIREYDKQTLSYLAGLENSHETLDARNMGRLHAWLSKAPSLAVSVQLEDIMMDLAQPNVPGTTDEEPNWRRRARLTIEALENDDGADIIIKMINSAVKKRRES